MFSEQPTSERSKPQAPVSWPSSLHHRILIPHHYQHGDVNDSYVCPYYPHYEIDLDLAMRLFNRYVEEVDVCGQLFG
jgi:hypothetical protein